MFTAILFSSSLESKAHVVFHEKRSKLKLVLLQCQQSWVLRSNSTLNISIITILYLPWPKITNIIRNHLLSDGFIMFGNLLTGCAKSILKKKIVPKIRHFMHGPCNEKLIYWFHLRTRKCLTEYEIVQIRQKSCQKFIMPISLNLLQIPGHTFLFRT